MSSVITCEICGNEREQNYRNCRFCGAAGDSGRDQSRPQYKIINLEKGMPRVSQALTRLDQEIRLARGERCRVLLLIHGYGSSGRGGAIRQEVRSQLMHLKDQKQLNDFLPGEKFSTRTGQGRHLLRRFPFLRQLSDVNRGNQGITLVVL